MELTSISVTTWVNSFTMSYDCVYPLLNIFTRLLFNLIAFLFRVFAKEHQLLLLFSIIATFDQADLKEFPLGFFFP